MKSISSMMTLLELGPLVSHRTSVLMHISVLCRLSDVAKSFTLKLSLTILSSISCYDDRDKSLTFKCQTWRFHPQLK